MTWGATTTINLYENNANRQHAIELRKLDYQTELRNTIVVDALAAIGDLAMMPMAMMDLEDNSRVQYYLSPEYVARLNKLYLVVGTDSIKLLSDYSKKLPDEILAMAQARAEVVSLSEQHKRKPKDKQLESLFTSKYRDLALLSIEASANSQRNYLSLVLQLRNEIGFPLAERDTAMAYIEEDLQQQIEKINKKLGTNISLKGDGPIDK